MNFLKVHQQLQKYLLKCRLKNLRLTCARDAPIHSRLQEGCSIISQKNTTKKVFTFFYYEFVASKCKLKDLIQLSKEENLKKILTGFFLLLDTHPTVKITRIVLSYYLATQFTMQIWQVNLFQHAVNSIMLQHPTPISVPPSQPYH